MEQIRELQEETRELINRFAAAKGLSKNELSKQLDVSGATLSNIENGHVEKLTESMLLKIRNKLNLGGNWTLVRTSNFLTIEKICNEARQTKRMYGIIGYSGAGKTTALNVYYKNHPDIEKIEWIQGDLTSSISEQEVSVKLGELLFEMKDGKFTIKKSSISLKEILSTGFNQLDQSIITTPSGPGSFSPADKLVFQQLKQKTEQLLDN